MNDGIQVMSEVRIVRDTQTPEYRREADKATREFEGVMLAQLFRVMRSTVQRSDLLGGEHEREIYEDLMFSEIARAASRAESIGIAEMLYRQLVGEAHADGEQPAAGDAGANGPNG